MVVYLLMHNMLTITSNTLKINLIIKFIKLIKFSIKLMPYNTIIKLLIFLNRVTHFIHYSSNINGRLGSNNTIYVNNQRIKLLIKMITPEKYKPKLIRIGSKYDGGYALAKYNKNNILISGGISNNSDFESSICSRIFYGYLFDHTIKILNLSINNYAFYRKKIVVTKGDQYGVNLNDFISQIDSKSLILKLDIEGDEWNILSQFSTNNLLKCEQIVVEFHNVLEIYNTKKFDLYIKVLTKIRKNHKVINVNVNNYGASSMLFGEKISDVYEISFLRNDLYAKMPKAKINMLTSKNNPTYPQVMFD
jgi:hypothetical protein